jgi:hypothetical protein
MNLKNTLIGGGLLAAALLAPGLASASFVLDTGTPTSPTGSPVTVLSTSQFVAAEFDVTGANVPINDLSVYMTNGVGNINDTFTVDIYSTANFTGRAAQRGLLYSATGKFTGNGWIDVPLNTNGSPWTPTSPGDYWVALQVSSTTQTHGLDLPGAGISTTSGTAPALAFAFAGTNGQFVVESTTAPTTPFGIELGQATPVPLPAAAWLLLSGLCGIGTLVRRRAAPLTA